MGTKNEYTKIINEIFLIKFTKDTWSKMWGDLSFADIKILDDYIKRLDIDYENVRKESKKINKELKKKTFAITLNPKIDSKKQRRLQCGIPYKKFIELFIDNKLEKNIIWGKKFDINLKSKPRTFRK